MDLSLSSIKCQKSKCLWQPNTNEITNQDRFRQMVNAKYDINLETYKDLHSWSVKNYSNFWQEVWNFTAITNSKSFDKVFDIEKRLDDLPPNWFSGSLLNYAENLLHVEYSEKIAIYAAVECGEDIKKKTFKELKEDVRVFSVAMRKMGIKIGDRVVGCLPNSIEAVIAMLATASIGAIWSGISPDLGVSGALDKISQIQPKLLISVDGVVYNNKTFYLASKLSEIVKNLPNIEKLVIISHLKTNDEIANDFSKITNFVSLKEFLFSALNGNGTMDQLKFEQLPFNHPLFIMFSSGTTGPPKCIVHSAGGTLIKHLEEHVLQGNMTKDDCMLYYTSTGWMMWNWFVTSLATGASIVCYDGSPLVPNQNVLWDLIDKLNVTILGTSAKWLAVLAERNIKPAETHNLRSLHTILSTGSPLAPNTYRYVYDHVKSDLLLGSITGGSDIIACFAGHNSNLPVHEGEIQSMHLGIDLDSVDEDGNAVCGKSGELICRKPFPSMPVYFWNDDEKHTKYKHSYFHKFDNVWAHGDFCCINPTTGGIWMLGRSDGTLNPNGVRFGSSEIYHIINGFKEIADCLCVAQKSKDKSEERVVLFVKMVQGTEFNDNLVKRIKSEIRLQLSARHLPAIVLPITEIPYTHTGKKVEIAVKKILAGEDVNNRGAYSNPKSLDLYYNLQELSGY